MENNSDKEMRDKLRGTEFPFDPRAWEQMESMLDADRKPRAFFWWWFGGVAACLLLATGILGYYELGHRASNSQNTLALNKTVNNNTEPATNFKTEAPTQNTNSTNANSTDNVSPLANTANPNDGFNTGNSVHRPKSVNSSTAGQQGASKIGNSLKGSKVKSPRVESHKSTTNTLSKTGNEMSVGKKHNHKTGKSETSVPRDALIASAPKAVNGSNTNETLAETKAPNQRAQLLDPISMEPVVAFEFPSATENGEDGMKKKDEGDVNLKKLKKKIFVYSLGIAANVTGATLGHQNGAAAADVFNRTPSYMVGLTHDFMFFNRFAISNSIMFSQTSFTVYWPKTIYGEGLENYTSKITELAVPIGLKVYAVNKSKIRFYLGAGVINHIKFKETFTYQYNATANSGYTFGVFPSQTQFTGISSPGFLTNSLSTGSSTGTSEFSINHASRYYASFYANAGAEFIVDKHFVIFTESMFYMALQKVGVQDKYKYNLGLNAGFRYHF